MQLSCSMPYHALPQPDPPVRASLSLCQISQDLSDLAGPEANSPIPSLFTLYPAELYVSILDLPWRIQWNSFTSPVGAHTVRVRSEWAPVMEVNPSNSNRKKTRPLSTNAHFPPLLLQRQLSSSVLHCFCTPDPLYLLNIFFSQAKPGQISLLLN